jgi:hypothetical protein
MQICNHMCLCFMCDVQWNWQTIVIGVCFLIFLLITKQIVSIFLSSNPQLYSYVAANA